MKVLKKVSIAGAFARKKAYEYEGKKYDADIKDGDEVKILDAGQIVAGQYGDQHVFSIETRNGPKNLAFNQTTINNLVDAYGDETASWTGKSVKVWIIKAMVSGRLQQIAYLAPAGWEMDDEGRFRGPTAPAGEGQPAETIEYPAEEIDPDSIPF